jgi:hypothetical protein
MSKSKGVFVEGIVAARDKEPYVVLWVNGERAQLSIAEAHSVAMDLLTMAARTEADAVVLRFFDKKEFPSGAASAIMLDFRHYRMEQDGKPVEKVAVDPDTGDTVQ